MVSSHFGTHISGGDRDGSVGVKVTLLVFHEYLVKCLIETPLVITTGEREREREREILQTIILQATG